MIECKKYSLTEFKKVLKITKWQWEEHREDLLEHLKLYFDYSITPAGRGYCVEIYEQYSEYEALPRKTKTPEIKAYYYEKTQEEVKSQPWNTGSNIARNIIAKKKNKYEHTITTMENYIRPIVKQHFCAPDAEHQWMRKADDSLSYIPLTEEQHQYLLQLFNKHNTTVQAAEIMGKYKAGYITKREAKELLFDITDTWYGHIMSLFKDKFNFVPLCVKHLEEVINFEN